MRTFSVCLTRDITESVVLDYYEKEMKDEN